MTADVAAAFARVAQLLVEYRDIIDTRPEHDAAARAVRGWSGFLLGLSDDDKVARFAELLLRTLS